MENVSIIKKPKSSKRGRKKSYGEDLMDVHEVAQLLKVSKSHIYYMTSKQLIPHIKVFGKKLLFNYDDIIGWVKAKKVSPKN